MLQHVCGWHWACVCVGVWSAAFTGVSQLADCASVLVVVVAVAMLLLLLYVLCDCGLNASSNNHK